MNVDSIHLYSPLDTSAGAYKHLELALSDVDLTRSYIIQSSTGLDVDEIFNQMYGTGTVTNDKYHNMVLPPRFVTMRIKLNPQWSMGENPSALRDTLYKMISFSRRGDLELRFYNGAIHVASLFGFITKFEAPVFSDVPEVQLTFKCPYPLLRAPQYTALLPIGTNPEIIDDLSTAPHGFKMRVTFNGVSSSPFTIQGIFGYLVAPFVINQAFQSGDVLHFSSEDDNKYLYYVRGGVTTHLADKIGNGSIWPLLFPGTNRLGFSSTAFAWNLFQHKPTYWGI